MFSTARRVSRAALAAVLLGAVLGAASAREESQDSPREDPHESSLEPARPFVTTFVADGVPGLGSMAGTVVRPASLYTQPAYSAAFARPGEPAVIRDSDVVAFGSSMLTDFDQSAILGQFSANATRTERTFTVYTCGIPDSVADFFLPFKPGCRVKLVGCPGGDCTHWPVENGLEMEETSVKGVFSVTTDLYQPGDEFAFAVFEGTCTQWEEEFCVKNENCGVRNNCEHRYDSGLVKDFKQVSCYGPNREAENHTCAGASPLFESSCARKITTSGDGFDWYNRIVPDATEVSYVWGTCDAVPNDIDAQCGNNFEKPPCFSMPEVKDPPVCTAAELTAKQQGFVDWTPDLSDPALVGHTDYCASEPVCKNASDRDVLFLLDASASQSLAAFQDDLVPLMKRLYCASMTTTNSRIGVMIFPGFNADTCNGGEMVIPMGRYRPREFESLVDGMRTKCCATATPTAEALMLARDILKGSNEFGLENAMVYMISDGGPAMNFGYVDCSDAAEDRFKRLQKWTTTVLGTEIDHWTGIDGEPSDHCHYSFRYVQLYGMLLQMFESRVVFVGVPNKAGWYPEPAQFSGGFASKSCFVNASGQFCGMSNVGHGVLPGSTHPTKVHNPDIVSRNAAGLRVGWGKAKQSCTFSNPKIYSFISKPTYANYYNVARWTDPNLHVRPFEMFCDPHPCIDPNLDNSTETVKLCIGEDTLRGGQQFGNMNKCIRDVSYDACRAKFGAPDLNAGQIDKVDGWTRTVTGSRPSRRNNQGFTCKLSVDGGSSFQTRGVAQVTCDDLAECVLTWA